MEPEVEYTSGLMPAQLVVYNPVVVQVAPDCTVICRALVLTPSAATGWFTDDIYLVEVC